MSQRLACYVHCSKHASNSLLQTACETRSATQHPCISATRHFSTGNRSCMPRRATGARGNKLRGMSAIKGTGVAPWIKLSVTKEDLKTPRKIKPVYPPTPKTHGLWKFFNMHQELLTEPYAEGQHGRAWSVEELRRKAFDDLHGLWWVCLYERNRILTETWTRRVGDKGFGETEGAGRKAVVLKTMTNIKRALTERWYAWEDARKLADVDPSIYPDADSQLVYDESMDVAATEEHDGSQLYLEAEKGKASNHKRRRRSKR